MYVQKEMRKVRKLYEEIFQELEGDDAECKVVWPSDTKMCYPKHVPKKESKKESKIDDKTFICSKKDENTSQGTVMKFVPDKILEEKTIVKSVVTVKPNPHDDLDVEQMKFLEIENLKNLPKNELISVRENVSLEMLWIQQAIQSRVQVSEFFFSLGILLRFLNKLFEFKVSSTEREYE